MQLRNNKCFQFVSEAGPHFSRYFDEIIAANGIPCFDFEDSFLGFSKKETARLKETQRNQTLDFVNNLMPVGSIPALE